MPMNLLKFISTHRIQGALLREFISKGLWKPAIVSCDSLIVEREMEIEKLKELKAMLEKEVG